MEKRFEALDSWRGICALMVVLFHFSPEFNWSLRGQPLIVHSDLFVDFFFVLSGFVIAGAYERRLREEKDFGGFILRRFGRLYPLHLATLAAMFAFALVRGMLNGKVSGAGGVFDGGLYDFTALFSNLLLVQAVGAENHLTWNFPSWSISTEFYTYIVFALVWVLLSKRALLATLAIAIAIPFVLMYVPLTPMRGASFLGCIYGFAVGVMVQRAHRLLATRLGVMSNRVVATIVEFATVALCIVYVLSPVSAQQIAPLVFALPVLVFAFEGGLLSSLLRTGPPRLLGTLSYSVYLTHIVVLTIVGALLMWLQQATGLAIQSADPAGSGALWGANEWMGDLMMLGWVGLVIGVSALTYRFIEVPGRDWGGRMAKRWSARRSSRRAAMAAKPA